MEISRRIKKCIVEKLKEEFKDIEEKYASKEAISAEIKTNGIKEDEAF